MGRLVAGVFAAVALTLGLAACGGSEQPNADLRRAAADKFLCEPPGWTVELHNSGVSCQQAGATVVMRPAGLEGPQVIRESSGGKWTCRNLAAPNRPEFLKCNQGKRFYTLEQTGE